MKTINQEMGTWIQIGLFAVIWFVLLAIEGHAELSVSAFAAIPHVVFLYTIILIAFRRWAWRWRCFRGWLVDLPDLAGKWEGQVATTWVDPVTGIRPPAIAATLTISQSFSEVMCSLSTCESTSESTAALLSKGEIGGTIRLSYVYSNRPSANVKHRSEIHDGAALLELQSGPERMLKGQYWTSRRTTGDMLFAFKGRRAGD